MGREPNATTTQVKKIAVKQREQNRKRVDSSSSNNSSSSVSVSGSGSDSITSSSGSSSVKNRVFCHRPHFQIGMCVCVACRFLLKPTWNTPGIDLESPGIPGKNLEFHEKSEKPGITWNWIQILPMVRETRMEWERSESEAETIVV